MQDGWLNFITKKDSSNKSINSIFNHKATNASYILASLILRDKDFLKDLKQGGRHNFINYVELSMAEVLTTDNCSYTIITLIFTLSTIFGK